MKLTVSGSEVTPPSAVVSTLVAGVEPSLDDIRGRPDTAGGRGPNTQHDQHKNAPLPPHRIIFLFYHNKQR